jgi:uncharacterized metal-binding protein YceD (DUF177 family)
MSARVLLAALTATPMPYRLVADAAERAALVARFDLLALDRLEAALEVWRTADGAAARGQVTGHATQACVVSGEPVTTDVTSALDLRFATFAAGGEIELGADELDVMPIENDAIDLAEAVAQTLALALPVFPRADDAVLAAVRARLLSEDAADAQVLADRAAARANPFAVLRKP